METAHIFDAHHSFFSPDGKLLAMIRDNELNVRKCKTLATLQIIHCPDPIKAVKWSPDSKMILCSMPRRNVAEIFAVESGEKVATVECCLTGGGRFLWGPTLNVLVAIEPYLLRALVWPLVDPTGDMSCKTINGLQPWAKPCVNFSPDGQWMAVVQSTMTGNEDFIVKDDDSIQNDSVALFSTITWRMSKRIKCSGLSRISGISWNPNGKVIAIWSDEPTEPILFDDVPSGETLATWQPDSNNYFVGLMEVAWSPSAQFVAMMTYNDKVFILCTSSWKTVIELECKEEIISKECDIFHEVWPDDLSISDARCVKLKERPVSIARLREDILCPTNNAPAGNGGKIKRRCLWSSGGRFLAVNSVLAPAAVWIWNTPEGFALSAILVLSDYVLDLSWDPVFNTLAMCCGQPGIILWNKVEGASCVCLASDLSSDFSRPPALRLAWSPSAKMLVVASECVSRVLRIRSGSKDDKEK